MNHFQLELFALLSFIIESVMQLQFDIQQPMRKKNSPFKETKQQLELTPSMKCLGMKTMDVEHVLKFKERFQRVIEQPIEIIQQLYKNQLPQKCMLHKNTYTIYCQNDHKPLCVNCTFQNAKHRLHRMLPIKNCMDFLKEDAQKLEKDIKKFVDEVFEMIDYVNSGMDSMEREFPTVLSHVQKCYGHLHQFLLNQQKQQVNQLKHYKETMKYEYAVLSAQLRKSVVYMNQKVQQYKGMAEQQQILTKINVLETLKNSSKLIEQQISLNLKQTQKYALHYQVFEQIEEIISVTVPKLFSRSKIEQKLKKSQQGKNSTPIKKEHKTPDSKSRSRSPITTQKTHDKKQKSSSKIANPKNQHSAQKPLRKSKTPNKR